MPIQTIKNLPNQKNFPYWVAAVAFSAAAFAYAGWIGSERECANREKRLNEQHEVQIRRVIDDCELKQKEATDMLNQFILKANERQSALMREVYKQRSK